MRLKLFPAYLTLASGATALALAMHYPLLSFVMAGLVFFFWGASYRWPYFWLLALPASLPVIGLAPWTGWITFEELDILVLAVATGSYARMAWPEGADVQAGGLRNSQRGLSGWDWLLAGGFAIATAVSMLRGFSDAGGFSFGWFQGYHEPMNSVRLAKSFFLALLLVPIWQAARQQDPEQAQNSLSQGLMLGLAAAALTTVWERTAFTGLFNFSTDYRTTGMFWEMHVGGAALDGFLALTVPFALRDLLVAKTPARWGLAATVLALAAYACLTTFSRGVYLAVPVGAAVFLALHTRQHRQQASAMSGSVPALGSGTSIHLVAALCLSAGFGVGATWMFQSSGYRGMAALLGTLVLMLPLVQVLRGFNFSQWLMGVVLGVLLTLLTGALAWLLPKGAYAAWGMAAIVTGLMLGLNKRGTQTASFTGPMAFGGFLAAVASTALVADHWGEAAGLLHATPVLLTVLGVCAVAGMWRKPLWPDALRWQATTAGVMALVAAVVGVMGGGAYMRERFSTGGQDFGGRIGHWQLGRDMLRTKSDWSLGKGLGRFPANYFLMGNPKEHPGDYRLGHEGDNSYITLTGGLLVSGWGEILRLTQRVSEPGKQAFVTARVRADKDVSLHFEVCEKHLLYNLDCVIKETTVKGEPGVWQDLRVALAGDGPTRGDWYAPRLLAFSMAIASHGGMANLDNVQLTRADGRQLLANGDFSEGMAHWFFSSDRNHLPWHIKNIFMNMLFDQGVLGVALWGLLLAVVLWRVSLGNARRHPLAPALAAGLAGFMVVGLFDSLLDVPRLAWLFYLLLLIALTLRDRPRPKTRLHDARTAAGMTLALTVFGATLQSGDAKASNAAPDPQVIQVGPQRTIKTIAAAAILARPGAIINVDSGDHIADVAVWQHNNVTVRAVGGRVRLLAKGAAAEGKAIWVVRAKGMRVEGFDFEGAAVPDRNGAGIRLETGSLLVRNCRFFHNEMGLLTNNDPHTILEIENSEFAHNQRPDGHNHNLYVGTIARLSVTGSYFHHAHIGHLLKSRAAVNHIVNNRLLDEIGGTASYELEFPNGGMAYVVGNTIAQSTTTQNAHLISFGAEGYKWPRNEIYLASNTLVNRLPRSGVFLRVAPGADAVHAIDNLLIGWGALESAGPGNYQNNRKSEIPHNPGAMQRPAPPPSLN